MKPKALILHATGSNRDLDLSAALELAGAQAEIVHINQLRKRERRWDHYQLLALPGGFSYADALGAGRLFALDLQAYFADEVGQFIQSGKPVIGICNGFQALVKSGILPAMPSEQGAAVPVRATLTFNACGHFECRWVNLLPQSQTCIWTRGLTAPVFCPVAHGEGNFIVEPEAGVNLLHKNDQVAFVYARSDGSPAGGKYPENPNGSLGDIAGICNPLGNVLGLMPHPENHIDPYQNPHRARNGGNGSGLALFSNGVRYAAEL
jgi:phosphoribosylformylglycinamidine synthase subunit PurQ / glutaminase